jgi:hypothetical protein
MKTSVLISVSIFTIIATLTVYGWYDMYNRRTRKLHEAFDDLPLSDAQLKQLSSLNEPVPTDAEAVTAHQTLLRYARNDFTKGIKFITDIGNRFYGDDQPFRTDLNLKTLMDNYRSPLQGVWRSPK